MRSEKLSENSGQTGNSGKYFCEDEDIPAFSISEFN
jgi:hypothetical protein